MDVVALDFDRVLANSIPQLIKVSIDVIGKSFPVEGLNEKAGKLVASFGGESFASSFKKALESLYPGKENEEEREKCCQIVVAKRESIYDKVDPFPGAIKVVQKITENYHVVISSVLERTIIDNWLARNGLMRGWFDEIYSLENGKKDVHIRLIRKKFSDDAVVFYVGDSFSDMKLGDIPIGIAGDLSIREQLFKEGARAVINYISSLERALKVFSRNKEIFFCGRATI